MYVKLPSAKTRRKERQTDGQTNAVVKHNLLGGCNKDNVYGAVITTNVTARMGTGMGIARDE